MPFDTLCTREAAGCGVQIGRRGGRGLSVQNAPSTISSAFVPERASLMSSDDLIPDFCTLDVGPSFSTPILFCRCFVTFLTIGESKGADPRRRVILGEVGRIFANFASSNRAAAAGVRLSGGSLYGLS